MNKKDRKRLAELIEKIQSLVNEVDKIGQSEQEKYDNLTEGLQSSERGQRYQEVADAIESACSTIEDGLSELNDLLEE